MRTDVRMAVALVLIVAGAAGSASAQQGKANGRQPGSDSGDAAGSSEDLFAGLPDSITLTGTVRDFRERHIPGGHDDFELRPTRGFGVYVGMVRDTLDAERKPVFAGTGQKVLSLWYDAGGRPVAPPRRYMSILPGDVFGAAEWEQGGALTTASNFAEWFRDVPGVNMSCAFPIVLERQGGTNTYVYDDRLATSGADPDGFFIVNNKLLGNAQGGNKNYHFTYELQANFVYDKGAGQLFTFRGDDDVWVFIDGKLVIDLGGVHEVAEQCINLDRLKWLQDGKTYPLHFFFAERHRPESNFRIETSLLLEDANVPTVSSLYD